VSAYEKESENKGRGAKEKRQSEGRTDRPEREGCARVSQPMQMQRQYINNKNRAVNKGDKQKAYGGLSKACTPNSLDGRLPDVVVVAVESECVACQVPHGSHGNVRNKRVPTYTMYKQTIAQ